MARNARRLRLLAIDRPVPAEKMATKRSTARSGGHIGETFDARLGNAFF
jgi:hypothetical protein